eukprot:CAMPEP_0181255338 /NCGR_PEP_ID=MMETSP1096-20121128/49095_1 /TAXON_ID=156174 ORGANISM="Chrysochromulina ericina, Strain CCMP281" /NCGR_SAMPLE_ID=MMETSP1096 /ASSEMBLY_ACC=CAM_ASM_000453 /LENGTH=85 /DNA_ID=CAMNT_0023353457 /DNA_START=121 /DNA_END=378 /DNA_ORIENTATION=-
MATGAGAGGAASYFIARGVWQGAQAQGDAVDSTCAQLQQLRDFRPELPPKRLEVPSLYELRLRRELLHAWNDRVWGVYTTLRSWV